MINIEVKFKGTAVYQKYYNDESCWGIFNVRTTDKVEHGKKIDTDDFDASGSNDIPAQIIVVVGKMQKLTLGGEYEFTGECEFNNKYKSWQYKVSSVRSIAPQDRATSKLFLQSILTEMQADTLLDVYPDIVNEVMNGTDKVDVSLLKGIGEKTWAKIKDKIINNFVISDLVAMLQPHGVTYEAIIKLLQGSTSPAILVGKIEENPYYLTRMRGYGFAKVDKIALSLKPELRVSDKRTVAFVKYTLHSRGENDGHTWIGLDVMKEEVRNNIPECAELFDTLVEKESNGGLFLHVEDDKIGLCSYYNVEKSIYDILTYLDTLSPRVPVEEDKLDQYIAETEKEQGFPFSDEQYKVIKDAVKHNVSMISGQAGSGKSTIARAILNIFRKSGCSVAACSLSAKAAQRIREATGFAASTIHMLLKCKGISETGSLFEFDAHNPLDYDVIFLDEASMVNASLLLSLLEAIKEGSRIVMCGDYKQLPPIGYGNPFSDLLKMHDVFASFELKTVHRQAAMSGILTDANKIRNGEFPIAEPSYRVSSGENKDMVYAFRDNRESLQELAVRNFLAAADKTDIDETVLIVPRRLNCPNSTTELNQLIQDELFEPHVPGIVYGSNEYKLGARVMQIENNYEKFVFNGEMGYVHDVDSAAPADDECMTVRFKSPSGDDRYIGYTRKELEQITLAYCCTVHKTQGSEWNNVVAVVDNSHYALLDSCLLYTAITRAKKKCMLLAEPDAFRKCIVRNKNKARQTWLREKGVEE